MKAIIFSVVMSIFISTSGLWASDSPSRELLIEANRSFMGKRYQDAVQGFQQALDAGFINGHVYYNLGNAYFEKGDLGKAVWSFMKARELLPRDVDIQANLKQAWRNTRDKLEWQAPHPASAVLFWIEDVTFEENLMALQWTCILFWVIWGIRSINGATFWEVSSRVALLFFLTAALSTFARWHLESNTQYGVILNAKQQIQSQPENSSDALFTLHEGTILRIRRTSGAWAEIMLIDGETGWVPMSSIGT